MYDTARPHLALGISGWSLSVFILALIYFSYSAAANLNNPWLNRLLAFRRTSRSPSFERFCAPAWRGEKRSEATKAAKCEDSPLNSTALDQILVADGGRGATAGFTSGETRSILETSRDWLASLHIFATEPPCPERNQPLLTRYVVILRIQMSKSMSSNAKIKRVSNSLITVYKYCSLVRFYIWMLGTTRRTDFGFCAFSRGLYRYKYAVGRNISAVFPRNLSSFDIWKWVIYTCDTPTVQALFHPCQIEGKTWQEVRSSRLYMY